MRTVDDNRRLLHKLTRADRPIKGILHHAGDAVRIFGTRNDDRRSRANLLSESGHLGRLKLDVRIERGNLSQSLKNLQLGRFRFQTVKTIRFSEAALSFHKSQRSFIYCESLPLSQEPIFLVQLESVQEFASIIESAWEDRANISLSTYTDELKIAIDVVFSGLDSGELRVAEKIDGEWITNQWIKKAVLLSFRITGNDTSEAGCLKYFDKVPLKFENFKYSHFEQGGYRVVPGATVRRGSYLGPTSSSCQFCKRRSIRG